MAPLKYGAFIFYCDDGELISIKGDNIADIKAYCGVGIDWRKSTILLTDYYRLKYSFGYRHNTLIKYNMNDPKVELSFANSNISHLHPKLLKDKLPLRIQILRLLAEHNAFLVGCGKKAAKVKGRPETTKKVRLEAFENLIQRLAYLAKYNTFLDYKPKAVIVAENLSSESTRTIPSSYDKLYNEGVGLTKNRISIGGKDKRTTLKELGFHSQLKLLDIQEEPLLEIADVATGILRDFFVYCFKREYQRYQQIKPLWRYINMIIHNDPNYAKRSTFKYENPCISTGLQLSPAEGLYKLLDDTYTELLSN